MNPRYIFAVSCQNTHTWWPRPPPSSLSRVGSYRLYLDFIMVYPALIGTLLKFGQFMIWKLFANLNEKYHFQSGNLNLSLSYLKPIPFCTHIMSIETWVESPGLEIPGENLNFLPRPDYPGP